MFRIPQVRKLFTEGDSGAGRPEIGAKLIRYEQPYPIYYCHIDRYRYRTVLLNIRWVCARR